MIDLRLGDCLEVMDKLIDEGVKVDLIITSPPYNLGHINRKQGGVLIKYNEYNDNMNYAEYEDWLIAVLNKSYELLTEKGKLYFNHKERHFKNYYFNPINVVGYSKFNILQTIIWQRGGCTFNIGRYVNCYENIIVGYKNYKKYMRINKENEKYFDVWKINPSKNDNHPATFPVELVERIISGYKNEKDLTVLDMFMGSGTTGVVCKKLNRNFIGIELDKKYFDIAKERIENTTTQETLF